MSEENKATLPPEVVALLPEQFQKAENPIAEMVKSYNASGGEIRKVRDEIKQLQEKYQVPDKYELDEKEIGFTPGEKLPEVLKKAGVTQAQAKEVLKGVSEHLLPAIQKKSTELELKEVAQAWGVEPGSKAFQEKYDEVVAWSKQNHPESVHNTLNTTAKGVMAMEAMRKAASASQRLADLSSTGGAARTTKADLDKLVADPLMYRDPEYTKKVLDIVEKAGGKLQ